MRPIRFGFEIFSRGPVAKIIEEVQYAEELDYDSVWFTDSQLVMPELYTKLTACALNTKRITLAPGVTNTRTRHPTVTASALATLADLAPGRVAAGIGVGGSSHHPLGWKPDRLADFRRNFELIARLLQGESVVDDGHELKLTWADPEITRQVRLDVHVGSGPRSQRLAGEMGYPVGLGAELYELPQALERINAGAAAVGRTAQGSGVCWWAGALFFSDDWQAIKEQMAGTLSMLFRLRYQRFRQGHLRPDELGVDVELARRVFEAYQYAEHGATSAPQAQLVLEQPDELWKEWLKGRMVGTPEEVLTRLRQGLQHEAISEVVFTPHLPTEQMKAIMETFAKEVRPFLSKD